MPQFLVEDVIAETCDETAIMGEWNWKNIWHMEWKWSESPRNGAGDKLDSLGK